MAFGRRVEAIQADVAFNVDLGQFRGDMGQVERVYEQTTGGMSSDALRLSIAQEKVARAIKRTGPESISTKQATLALRREMDSLATSSGRAGRAVDNEARSVDRFSRSSRAGTGAARGLARSVGFVAASFLGGAGLVYGLKSVLNAAKESELVLGQTKLAVRAAGLEWGQYGNQIEAAIAKQSRLGFDDEALLKTFSVFVTRTKDVTKALELNALAVDVSRGRYIDLEAAQQIVLKASLGQAGQLKRLGLDVEKNATSVELLAKLTESYGGRAAGALGTATASQERMNVSLENAKEIIGSGLTPIVADLSDQISDYLDDAGRQEQLQQRVNQAVKDGTAIAHGLADGIDTIRKVTGPVVEQLGGLENVVQLVLIGGVVYKSAKAIVAVRGLATAFGLTSRTIAAEAVVMGRVIDVATRPRNIVITTTGPSGVPVAPASPGSSGIPGAAVAAGAGAAAAKGAGKFSRILRGKGGASVVERISEYGVKTTAPLASLVPAAPGGALGFLGGFAVYGFAGAGAGVAQREPLALLEKNGKWYLDYGNNVRIEITAAQAAKYRADKQPKPRGEVAGAGSSRGGRRNDRGVNAGKGQTPRDRSGGGGSKPEPFNLDLNATRRGRGLLDAQSRAGFDTSFTNDLAADRAIEAYYRAGLATAKKGTEAYTQILAAYVSAHRQSQSTIEQINQEKESNRKVVADKRQADAKRAKAAIDKAQLEQYRSAAATANKSPLMGLVYDPKTGFYESTKPGAKASRAGASAEGLSQADVARQVHEALSQLHGVIGQFGSNLSGGGTAQLETHAYAQTDLQRKQLAALERLGAGMWFPGSGYSQTQLGAAGIGSGF